MAWLEAYGSHERKPQTGEAFMQYFLEGGAITTLRVLIGSLGAAALAANQIVFSVLGVL